MSVSMKNMFIAILYQSRDIDQNQVSKDSMDPALFALLEVLMPFEKLGIIIDVDGVHTVFWK